MATPLRNVRVYGELWAEVQQVAASRGETVTAVIIRSLEQYCDSEDGQR